MLWKQFSEPIDLCFLDIAVFLDGGLYLYIGYIYPCLF
jgi:hypothetical protein